MLRTCERGEGDLEGADHEVEAISTGIWKDEGGGGGALVKVRVGALAPGGTGGEAEASRGAVAKAAARDRAGAKDGWDGGGSPLPRCSNILIRSLAFFGVF